MKRVLAFVLSVCLLMALVPVTGVHGVNAEVPESLDQCCNTLRVNPYSLRYARPEYDGYLIEITPQRVADTFAYLDELYIEKCPEAALLFNTGTEEDRKVLKTLAQTITEGCATDTQKADAIDAWMDRNIYYEVNASAYASDTFYHREGNCLSYANLMQFLLRSLGIPAVVGDGWRGDMKENTVDLFNYAGHAWCFVYLEGEWVLYDPLWLDGGTTDRDYMAEWIYFDTVEFVCPVSDGNNLPPEPYDKTRAYYTNGKPYLWSEFFPDGVGTLTCFVNNQSYVFVSNQCEEGGSQDGWYYLDGVTDKTQMDRGEVYRNSWISYGDYYAGRASGLTYAHANGMNIDGAVMTLEGQDYLMQYTHACPILADEADYTIINGVLSLKPGYTGPFLGYPFQAGCVRENCFITWDNENPEIAAVDENGIITCYSEGYAGFFVRLQRTELNGNITLLGSWFLEVYVSEEERVPDYSDYMPHEHEYVLDHVSQPTCEEYGVEYYLCVNCPDSFELFVMEPLGHEMTFHGVIRESTCITPGVALEKCIRCDYAEEYPLPLQEHTWDDGEQTKAPTGYADGEITYTCTVCNETKTESVDNNIFSDVKADRFEEAILWAYYSGITSGTGDGTTFSPEAACTRKQIVTFLWRAAGEPEPKSMVNPFTDVKSDRFEKAILWAYYEGITSGTGDGSTFSPEDTCTRKQIVTFLWRFNQEPAPKSAENKFTDVKNDRFTNAILWAAEQGITTGTGDGTTFSPESPCTRKQIVTFLFRNLAEE